MEKEIKINCPEGYEIDKENSTFECIRFKSIKKELPKTWGEFCANNLKKIGEAYYDSSSNITIIDKYRIGPRCLNTDRCVLPSLELAEAMRALCQLIQLRDCYNNGWIPDWTKNNIKYVIYYADNTLTCNSWTSSSRILAFKTMDLRTEFYNNFKDLIEIAKPLL